MITLKIKRKGVRGVLHPFFAKKVGLTFEHWAWFFAWDFHDVEPYEYEKLDYNTKLITIVYGAAKWWCMKNRKKANFSYDDIERSLMAATMEKNRQIGEAMANASFPKWLESEENGEPVKKK
jgi:hypothetical protein